MEKCRRNKKVANKRIQRERKGVCGVALMRCNGFTAYGALSNGCIRPGKRGDGQKSVGFLERLKIRVCARHNGEIKWQSQRCRQHQVLGKEK